MTFSPVNLLQRITPLALTASVGRLQPWSMAEATLEGMSRGLNLS